MTARKPSQKMSKNWSVDRLANHSMDNNFCSRTLKPITAITKTHHGS